MTDLQAEKVADSSTARRGAVRDVFEIVIGYGLILAVIWTPNPAQRILYWIALVTIVVITLLRREGLKTLGLGGEGFLRSLWIPGVALLFAAVAAAVAWQLHTLHRHFGGIALDFHFSGYIIWALMQQFLLQDFFLARFLRLTHNPWRAVAVTAALFAIAHIPNPVLAILTLVWGFAACVLFQRYRNLYTLGIAHAILGICVAVTVPNHIQRHMRVGLGYLQYHAGHFHPHRS